MFFVIILRCLCRFAVSRLQYHFQPAASGPHAIYMQKDANGEHYLTSTTQQNPLYVPPPSNSCQSAKQSQQPPFHLVRLQSAQPNPPNNELRSNNQTMHIKQLHTATVHGKQETFHTELNARFIGSSLAKVNSGLSAAQKAVKTCLRFRILL